MIANIPIIMETMEKLLFGSCLMFNPKNTAEIPKNSRLKPTMTETNPAENIGNMMNIKPRTIANIPAYLLTPIFCHLH